MAAGLLAALTVGSGGAASAAPACTWTAQALPTRPDTERSAVTATDGGGRFAGEIAGADFTTHPARWDRGRLTDLGAPFGGAFASAGGVNRSAVVVGSATDPARGGEERAFLHDGRRYVRLAEPAGTIASTAIGVTDAGTVVGWATRADSTTVGLVWTVQRPDRVRVVSAPGLSVLFTGIALNGTVAGTVGTRFVDEVAITWTPRTGIRRLRVDPDATSSLTVAAAGRYVAGSWFAPADKPNSQGVVWVDGRPRLLAGDEVPLAVNARGTAAGGVFGTALVWTSPTAAAVTLPALAGVDAPAGAAAVTLDGKVAGWSRSTSGVPTGTVWTCR